MVGRLLTSLLHPSKTAGRCIKTTVASSARPLLETHLLSVVAERDGDTVLLALTDVPNNGLGGAGLPDDPDKDAATFAMASYAIFDVPDDGFASYVLTAVVEVVYDDGAKRRVAQVEPCFFFFLGCFFFVPA